MTRIPRNRPTLCGHSVCGQPALYAIRRLGTCMELKLGVVGLASHAEDVQKEFHDMIGGDEPMGWDTQLPDEPVITWATRLRTCGTRAVWAKRPRLVPIGHVGLGTYFTGVGLGTMARSAGIWWMPWARPHSARG